MCNRVAIEGYSDKLVHVETIHLSDFKKYFLDFVLVKLIVIESLIKVCTALKL